MKKIIFTLILAIFALTLFFACGQEADKKTQKEAMPSQEQKPDTALAANMVVDPVCGMKIKKEEAMATIDHQGQTYYFCMQGDQDTFVADPAKYLAKVDEPE